MQIDEFTDIGRLAAIILTATGERAFCTGGDVTERAETGGFGETDWRIAQVPRHRDSVGSSVPWVAGPGARPSS